MSQENVEIIRRHHEAFNRSDLAAILEWTDPEAEWRDRADDPDAAVHRGHEAIMKHLADLADLAELRIEPQEFIGAGDSVVVPFVFLVAGGPATCRSRSAKSMCADCETERSRNFASTAR
jgi:ketosteroid isomerase-like protein